MAGQKSCWVFLAFCHEGKNHQSQRNAIVLPPSMHSWHQDSACHRAIGGDWGPSMRAVFSSHPGRQNWSWVCTIQNIFNVHAWHIVLTSLCPSCDISGSWISLYKAFLSLKHKQLITVCVSFLTCLSQDFENWSACLWYSSLLDTCVFSSLLIWHLMNFCELSALEELQQFRNLTRLALIWRQKTNKEFMKSH